MYHYLLGCAWLQFSCLIGASRLLRSEYRIKQIHALGVVICAIDEICELCFLTTLSKRVFRTFDGLWLLFAGVLSLH